MIDPMNRFLLFALACLPGAASAQTPAASRMPDGSRDSYVGLGLQSAPRYAGASEERVSVLPAVQFAWSNGAFVSGANLGWHLSESPTVEFGPLLTWQPRRRSDGDGRNVGVITTSIMPDVVSFRLRARRSYGLAGLDDIPARAMVGAFFNYYLTPDWRLTNSLLAGAGIDRDGVQWRLGLQRIGVDLGNHHSLGFNAGLVLANRAYNQAYSGISAEESARSAYAPYQAGTAFRSVRLGVRWNWDLSSAWLLTSGLEASRLLDVAANSPLTLRPGGITASTVLAYRF